MLNGERGLGDSSRSFRFDFETAVVLMPYGGSGSFVATSVNLSESGMLLKADREVEKGLRLEFMAARFAGECQVIWSHETESGGSLFGIMFTSLGPTAKDEIKILLDGITNSRGHP